MNRWSARRSRACSKPGAAITGQYLEFASLCFGNPPYSAHQANENDNNKNREYPFIDDCIKKTYSAESTAQKTKLYDLYAHFFRWTSDRLHVDGVLAFVANRSFIDSRSFDGFRKTVAAEFAEICLVEESRPQPRHPPACAGNGRGNAGLTGRREANRNR